MNIAYISTYVPRKCGIATYTRDLSSEVHKKHHEISVVAMENPLIPVTYSSPVADIIRQEKLADYDKAVNKINASTADIVHLQHEFGLFGGEWGDYILQLAQKITKPLIVTFHTVLLTPDDKQKYIIQELARLSRKVIVMDEVARNRLEKVYGLDLRDTDVILHGAPVVKVAKEATKKKLGLSQSFLMVANNLLSRNKGIEYAIEAVAKVAKDIPNIIFLIVGETHPLVIKSEGESYREELVNLVKKLHLEKHVIFKNTYIPLEELQTLLAAADVYITPYLDPQQITSGTLSYAVGAGKACIATEYIYAKEILSKGRGILVPFRNSDAIASALTTLYRNPQKRQEYERKAHTLGKGMQWPRVAEKHINLYKYILVRENTIPQTVSEFIKKPLDITYLKYLTDDVGIIQHAHHFIPNRRFGYSIDDCARALIVVSHLYQKQKTEPILHLIKVYLSYLHHAQDPNGKFHNFLDFKRTWDTETELDDSYGRTMWALGYYLYVNKDFHLEYPVRLLFIKSLEQVQGVEYIRSAAYTMLGLYYYTLAYDTKSDESTIAFTQMKRLADLLITAYEKNHDRGWDWFEEIITYDNFRLPQALFAAYIITGIEKYKTVASATLQFITQSNYDKQKKYYDFIGQDGWYKKGGQKAEYDQQPLEAAGAVDAYIFAATALHKRSFLTKAYEAFSWYFGSNRNHRYLYDEQTKGVHDGLVPTGVNQNEGAESIVCFLISQSMIQQYKSDNDIKHT